MASKAPAKHEEPENPIVKEREPSASSEVESGAKTMQTVEDSSVVVPVTTKTAETEFRIITH